MTKLDKIEKELFDKVIKMEHDQIIIRVYVSAMKMEGKKFFGKSNKKTSTEVVVGIQIANKILNWNDDR